MAADDHSSTDSSANNKLTWETPRVVALDEPTIANGLIFTVGEIIIITSAPS